MHCIIIMITMHGPGVPSRSPHQFRHLLLAFHTVGGCLPWARCFNRTTFDTRFKLCLVCWRTRAAIHFVRWYRHSQGTDCLPWANFYTDYGDSPSWCTSDQHLPPADTTHRRKRLKRRYYIHVPCPQALHFSLNCYVGRARRQGYIHV